MASVDIGVAVGDGMSRSANDCVLGLDIGGTKLAAGVVAPDGTVRGFVVAPTLADRGPDEALSRLFELGRQAVAESGAAWDEIEAVGIGCGGPLDWANGVLIAPLHLPGWRDVRVVDLAQAELGRPAVLENDATAAAAGEHRYRARRRTHNMLH